MGALFQFPSIDFITRVIFVIVNQMAKAFLQLELMIVK